MLLGFLCHLAWAIHRRGRGGHLGHFDDPPLRGLSHQNTFFVNLDNGRGGSNRVDVMRAGGRSMALRIAGIGASALSGHVRSSGMS